MHEKGDLIQKGEDNGETTTEMKPRIQSPPLEALLSGLEALNGRRRLDCLSLTVDSSPH